MVDYRGGISIFEILIYGPCIPLGIFLTIRHGFRRSTGWIYVIMFAQVRIAGAVTQLLSESNKTNIGLYTAETILQSLGLTPLMFMALGILSRVNGAIALTRKRPVSRWTTHGVGALVSGASILCIIGGIHSSKDLSAHKPFKIATDTKIGIILFVVSFVALVNFTIITSFHFPSCQPPSERRLGIAILASIPLLGIRLLYSLLACFSSSSSFNLLTGSVTAWLFLAVIPEMLVVACFLAAGFMVERQRKNGTDYENRVPSSDEPMLMNSRDDRDYQKGAAAQTHYQA